MLICSYCNKPTKLVTGKVLYPHRKDLYNLYFWNCEDCRAYVGTHKGKNHQPLGTVGNLELRNLRKSTHKVFDKLWKDGLHTRSSSYLWLSQKLRIPFKECHIAMFNIIQCKETIAASVREYDYKRKKYLDKINRRMNKNVGG